MELGRRLGHCIGSLANTGDLFFYNGGTVCAQVHRRTLELIDCRDSQNRRTRGSKAFTRWLDGRLSELRSMVPSRLRSFERLRPGA